jgi:hypothetical protein
MIEDSRSLAFAVLLGAVSVAAAQTPQDSVARDPESGDWIYTLHNPDDPKDKRTWRYVPRNKITPKVRSVVRKSDDGYEYATR